MADTNDMIFSMNELVAIYNALESQIEDCQNFLTSPVFTIPERKQINQVVNHSKSALARLDIIFKEKNYNLKIL